MKRTFVIFSALILFLLPQSLHAAWATLHVGVYDFDPLCDTQQNGFFIELIDYIAEQEGWQLAYVPGTLQECFDKLGRGKIDLLVAASYTQTESTRYDFSRETVISTWAQVYSQNKADIQSLLGLASKTIGVVRDDYYNQELRSIIKRFDIECRFVEFKTYQDVLSGVEKGWIDAGVVDRLYGALHVGEFDVEQTPIIFSPIELRYAVTKGLNKQLISAVDYHLHSLKKDPRSIYYQLINSILSENKESKIIILLRWVVTIAAALLLLFGMVNLLLRQQVKTKTAELSRQNREMENEIVLRRNAERKLLQQKQYLSALHETSLGVIGRLHLDELLETIVARAASLVETEHGFIFIADPDGKKLVMRVGLGAFAKSIGLRISPEEGISGKVWTSGEPLIVDNYSIWPHRVMNSALENVHCVIGLPLKTKETVVGVIGLGYFGSAEKFEENEINILSRFAELASIALNNAQLYEKIDQELMQRRLAEEARMLLSAAIEQSAESVIITDINGTVLYVNPAFERETGFAREEVLGKENRFMDVQLDEDLYGQMWDQLSRGTAWTGRFSCKRKNGGQYQVEATISPVRNEEDEIINFVSVSRDITKEINLERQLVQAQKMEAIGTLAGGIAHDFNNILTPIIGFTEMTVSLLHEDNTARYNLERVLKSADRARGLVQQILTFSRKQEQERKPLLIQPIVKEALKLIRASLPSTIEIRHNIQKEAGTVLAEPTQLHQVIMNLCTNAYHAMGERGGLLDVTIKEVDIDTADLSAMLDLEKGKYLRINVSDNGIGMDPDTLERIFEPYFTTKGPGKGTGMGLAIVHGIVAGYGGKINVYSKPGEGTTFHIYLPRTGSDIITSDDASELLSPRGKERILLVDDEEDVVAVIYEMLTGLGYQVTALTNCAEALETFRRQPNQFDLVVTDLTMPVMTGIQLTKELLAVRKDIAVILCTGYSDRVVTKNIEAIGIKRFLLKPLKRRGLAESVREVLDEQREQYEKERFSMDGMQQTVLQ